MKNTIAWCPTLSSRNRFVFVALFYFFCVLYFEICIGNTRGIYWTDGFGIDAPSYETNFGTDTVFLQGTYTHRNRMMDEVIIFILATNFCFLLGEPICYWLFWLQLESYWTYELCHGKYMRQFHEDREGKKHKLQEFYLGKWDSKQLETMDKSIFNVHGPIQMLSRWFFCSWFSSSRSSPEVVDPGEENWWT